MDEPILTERLRMRPWETDDLAAVRAIFADPEVGQFVGVRDTPERAEQLIAAHQFHQARHGFSMWAVEERATGDVVGEIGLQLLQQEGPEVEVGWVVARPAWGRGYATEAARVWLQIGFGTLALTEIIAVIRPENEGSQRVAKRLGMEPAGSRFVYDHDHDVYVARAPR